MSSNRTIYKRLWPGILLGLLVLCGLALLGGLEKVFDRLSGFHWIFFGFAVAFAFLNQSLRFLKYAVNLHRSGIQNVSFGESVRLFLACYPLEVTDDRFGDSFKGIWLFKKSGLPVERAVSIFYVDKLSDSLSVFVLMAIGTLSFPSLWPLFLSLFLAFMGVMVYLQTQPVELRPAPISSKVPILKRILPQLRESAASNPALFSTTSLLVSSVLGILSWAAEGAALFFVLVGLGFPPSLPLVATAILVFAFSTTVGMVSGLPGGIGVAEVAVALLLTLLLNFQPDIAVTATILFRLATFWLNFLFGLLIWSVSGKALGIQTQEGRVIES